MAQSRHVAVIVGSLRKASFNRTSPSPCKAWRLMG